MVGSLHDEVPSEGRNVKITFAFGVAYTSLILGALFSIANIVDFLRSKLIGNLIENGECVYECTVSSKSLV